MTTYFVTRHPGAREWAAEEGVIVDEQVELFFKWIKQNLRIKSFYGTSENAVKTQIWIAVSVYVLVAIMKKRLNIEASLYTILQVLSVTALEKMPLIRLLAKQDYRTEMGDYRNSLFLFD
ncbi:MAG: hypothetical protein HZA20_11015 [Nitrospirae bacterium]|nr:hypothetical protein [Nitrospirota bacterium]